jgi:uncharacterized protein (TIGR03067 family)
MKLRVLVVLTAVLLLFSGTQAGEKKKSTWKFVSIIADGKEVPKKEFEEFTLYIDGDKGVTKKGDKVVSRSTAKIDFEKKPITIDVTITEGKDKGKVLKGIMEFKDEGKIVRICWGGFDKDRPKEFSSKEGSGHILEEMKKVDEK